ncbi:MAG TPA: uracil phosphoribosyltransferase [candidate division Zixibacteria bacterium]|nr:uracil phosphoribosyltransferase [candidate division Zixibacteria bacterium]
MRTDPAFPNLYILDDHALISHNLTQMRKKETPPGLFRAYLHTISILIGYELTQQLPMVTALIETPITTMSGQVINEHDIGIVSILRAGLGMAEGLKTILPHATEGHIGVFRDLVTTRPVEYYTKLPDVSISTFIVVDPMVATGYSAIHAIDVLNKAGIEDQRIQFMALISAPEGVRVFHDAHPDIPLYTAGLDNHLNDHAYIVPGLGDAGDRLFGTV